MHKVHKTAESHLGVRLNIGDFARATEQTAVLMALASGRKLDSHRHYRAWATRYCLGYLRASCSYPRFVLRECEELSRDSMTVHEPWTSALKTLGRHGKKQTWPPVGVGSAKNWRVDATRYEGTTAPRDTEELALDICAIPLDGANNLFHGQPGTISVVAAGEPDCFARTFPMPLQNRTPEPLAERYFVIVVNQHTELNPRFWSPGSDRQGPFAKTAAAHVTPDAVWVGGTSKFAQLALNGLRSRSGRSSGVSLAWIEPPPNVGGPLPRPLAERRHEALSGSSIAGAIATLRSSRQLDVAMLFARPHLVVAMSVAAQVLRGSLYALPVNRDGQVVGAPIVRTATDFVPKKRAFMVATGCTRTRALEPVRFLRDARVSTHTICLSLTTGSVRDVEHAFSLETAIFRDALGRPRHAADLVREFMSELNTRMRAGRAAPRVVEPKPTSSGSTVSETNVRTENAPSKEKV